MVVPDRPCIARSGRIRRTFGGTSIINRWKALSGLLGLALGRPNGRLLRLRYPGCPIPRANATRLRTGLRYSKREKVTNLIPFYNPVIPNTLKLLGLNLQRPMPRSFDPTDSKSKPRPSILVPPVLWMLISRMRPLVSPPTVRRDTLSAACHVLSGRRRLQHSKQHIHSLQSVVIYWRMDAPPPYQHRGRAETVG